MNILIVKTSAIGDVTHTLPALHCLRQHYPEASITWLVEEAATGIVKDHKALDRVLVSRRKYWAGQLKGRGVLKALKEIVGFIREVRDTKYDLIIDFQGLLKSGILIGLAKGKRKVGFGRGMEHAECSYLFLNEHVKSVDMNIHALDRELLLLKAIGVECPEIVFDFPVSKNHIEQIDELLHRHGLNGKSLMAINPLTKWDTKLWQNQRFGEVADQLLAEGYGVVFTGSKEDRPALDSILANMQGKAVNLAGLTDLKGLAALYKKTEVLISTDTGPMHIAVAVGTPVVALFGPTAPWRTGPYGDIHQIVRSSLSCSPCLKRKCDTIACMNEISVKQVMEAVYRVLPENGR